MSAPRGRLAARWIAGAALAVLMGLLLAGPTRAQVRQIASDPADRSLVSAVPASVSLTFAQDVLAAGLRVRVVGPDGGDVTSGGPTVTGNVVRQRLSARAPAGRYSVRWRVVPGDGHPVSGSFIFTAKAPAGTPPLPPSPAGAPAAGTAATAPPRAADPAGEGAQDGDAGLSGLATTGLAAVVLVVLMAATTAITRLLRARRGTT